jgi:hypothetical protein
MNEQRKDILDMLTEGKIIAVEAEQLLAALDQDQPPAASNLEARPKARAKYLRVLVENLDEMEPGRINIRVPLQLLRAGVRLAALVPPQALEKANAGLVKSGVPYDLTQLKPEQLGEFVEYLDDLTVDIEAPDAKVRVFCE